MSVYIIRSYIKKNFFFFIVISGLLFMLIFALNLNMMSKVSEKDLVTDDFWKTVDFQQNLLPNNLSKTQIKIEDKWTQILGVKTFYREALPLSTVDGSSLSILLLHGAAFKSQTWKDLGTIEVLAAVGHQVIAVDLPGYGETKSRFSGDKVSFLKEFIDSLHLKNLVIVSPSMSGGFSIPFLLKNWQLIDGFVPVAPVSTNLIENVAADILVPTLIIYGENDKGLGLTSLGYLSALPNSQAIQIPKARHPAYLDNPKMFHTLLHNFLIQIKHHKIRV